MALTPSRRMVALGEIISWLALGSLVGIVCGTGSALFLYGLELVTSMRVADPRWVFALPLAGFGMGLVFERFGKPIKGGHNLIIDTLHEEGPELPLRMAPLVLGGTLVSHLFGASVGREGTAVQMGASLTDWLSHRLKVGPALRLQLLAAGIAGGFGSVFGTPIAGTVFGLECVVLGRLKYDAIVPALVAAVVGDMTTRAWGIHHTAYPLVAAVPLTGILAAKWLIFAAVVALVTVAFIELTHFLKRYSEQKVPWLPLRLCLGGLVVVGLWQWVGTDVYLGLGLPTIVRAFEEPALPLTVFALKLLFTAIALGSGFPGGEVTPLFFIGATLGGALAHLLGIPVSLGAGVGMATVFAAAANTPLAMSLMAVELLGLGLFPHVAIVAFMAYLFTGHRGIYLAQRLVVLKTGKPTPAVTTLEKHRLRKD